MTNPIKCQDKNCPRYGLENVCFTNLILFCNIRDGKGIYSSKPNSFRTLCCQQDKTSFKLEDKAKVEASLTPGGKTADTYAQQYNCFSEISELTPLMDGSVEAGGFVDNPPAYQSWGCRIKDYEERRK